MTGNNILHCTVDNSTHFIETIYTDKGISTLIHTYPYYRGDVTCTYMCNTCLYYRVVFCKDRYLGTDRNIVGRTSVSVDTSEFYGIVW